MKKTKNQVENELKKTREDLQKARVELAQARQTPWWVYPIGVTGGLMIILLIMAVIGAIYYVPGGSQGVMLNKVGPSKGYQAQELTEGFALKTPFLQSVTKLPYRTQTLSMCMDGCEYSSLTPKDKAAINFDVDITIRYELDKTQIAEIVKYKGPRTKDIEALVVTAARADSTRGVFGDYNQESIPELRDEISPLIMARLQERLDSEATGELKPGFITVKAVDIRNVNFADEIEQRIIQKQAKKQLAEEKVYDIDIANKTRVEALILADKDRQAKILVAEGDAQATLLKGEAQAKAAQLVNDAYQDMPNQFVSSRWAEAIQPTDKIIFGLENLGGNLLPILDVNQVGGLQSQGKLATEEE